MKIAKTQFLLPLFLWGTCSFFFPAVNADLASQIIQPSADFALKKRDHINDLWGIRDLGIYGEETRSIARYKHPDGKQRNLCVYSGETHLFDYTLQNYQFSTNKYLEVKYTDEMDILFSASGRDGAGNLVSIMRPKTMEGYSPVGDVAVQKGQATPGKAMMVKTPGEGILAPPTNYTEVWTKTWGESGDADYAQSSVWAPVPAKGFVCLGHVWSDNHQKPPLDLIRCVAKKFVEKEQASSTSIWTKSGSGGGSSITMWQVGDAGATSLKSGTYIAKDCFGCNPPAETLFALKKQCVAGYGEFPFCSDEPTDLVTSTATNAKSFKIPYGQLVPCSFEEEDQTIYGLINKDSTWEDYAVELYKNTPTNISDGAEDETEPFVGYKHFGVSKRLNKPYCLGTTVFGSSKLNNDQLVHEVYEGTLELKEVEKLIKGTLERGTNLTRMIDGDFVFLFPCDTTNTPDEYKKELQALASDDNKDELTENGVANNMEYLGSAASFANDESWKHPHFCGLSEEPTEAGTCEEVNDCIYENGECLAYDGASCETDEECVSGHCSMETMVCGLALHLFESKKGGELFQILPTAVSYGVQQDGPGNFVVSQNQNGVSLFGNAWKAFAVQPHIVSMNSILEFDVHVAEQAEGHAICLDEDLQEDVEIKGANRCFHLDGSETTWSEVWKIEAPGDLTAQAQHYKIYLGDLNNGPESNKPYLSWGATINYLALVQDNDANPKIGESMFSNLQLYTIQSGSTETVHELSQTICDKRKQINDMFAGREQTTTIGEGSRSILRYSWGGYQNMCVRDDGKDGGERHATVVKIQLDVEEIQKETSCKDSGQLQNLDRHTVDCGAGYVMTAWHVEKCGDDDKIRIKYSCRPIADAPVEQKRTSCQEVDGRYLQNIDRFGVHCNSYQGLQQWQLTREGCSGINMAIAYKCANVEGISHCTEEWTPCNTIDDRELIYLDRHQLKCPNPKRSVMKSWNMERTACGSKESRFKMICCEAGLVVEDLGTATLPIASLVPCNIEEEDQSIYGLANNNEDWEKYEVELYKKDAFVGFKHQSVSERMGEPYCIGDMHVGVDRDIEDRLYDSQQDRFNVEKLSSYNSEPFVFLFPCERPEEFSKLVDLGIEKAQEWKDKWTYYDAVFSPSIGSAAQMGDPNWSNPHYCGCGQEPTTVPQGGCRKIDACFYDSTVCPMNSACQKDGSSCVCSSGFLSSVEGTPTVFTDTRNNLCIPADLSTQQDLTATSFIFNIDKTQNKNFHVDFKRRNLDFPDQAPYSVALYDGKDIVVADDENAKEAYSFIGLLPGEEYTVKMTPETEDTYALVQETKAVTHCCCDCDTGIEGDTSGRPVHLSVYQDDGHVMFKYTDNSRCSEAFAFTRSEVGREFMDQEDETLKQVFTPNYYFFAKKKCGMAPIMPGISSSDDLSYSRLPVNKIYRYCVRAVAKIYSADSLQSSDETCKIHAIRWQASLDGAITTAPEAGRLPVEDVAVSWELLNKRKTRVIASGSAVTDKPGKFTIPFDELDKDLDRDSESPVRVRFSKTTSIGNTEIEHQFLCDDGETDCTAEGTIVFLKQLTFDKPLSVYDATTIPIRGRIFIMESSGCPLIGAEVCLKIKKPRYGGAMPGPCVKTDFQGDFSIGAAIGTTVFVEASYNNHTIVKAPENVYDYNSGVFVDATKRYERNDFVDIQTNELKVQVAGGLCDHKLGTSTIKVKINGCSYWEAIKEQSAFQKRYNAPAHVLDVSVTNVVSEEGKEHRNVVEFFAGKTETIDLTALSSDEGAPEDAKTAQKEAPADTADEKSITRFQYDGIIRLEFFLSQGQDTGECHDMADEEKDGQGTSSVHVVATQKPFVAVATLRYELLASESLFCDVVEDGISVRFINKVGVDQNDFDEYANELKEADKESVIGLLKLCSGDSGCTAKVKHEEIKGEKSYAHAMPVTDDGKDTLLMAGRPYIYGDYHKHLQVEALDVDNEIIARHHAHVIVTGDYDLGAGKSFALPTHKPIMILRDPPGGLSTATYSNVQTTIKVTSSDVESLHTNEFDYSYGLGVDGEIQAITGTPFAGVDIPLLRMKVLPSYNGQNLMTIPDKQEEKSYTSEFTTTWTYTTSDNPLWAGRDSDIMVVPNLNVQYHDVVTLAFDKETCKVDEKTDVKFNLNSPSTESALSFLAVGYIEGQKLPELTEAYRNKEREYNETQKEQTLKELQILEDALSGWNQTMEDYDKTNELAEDGKLEIPARDWFKKWAQNNDEWTTLNAPDDHWSALAPEGLAARAEKLSDLSYEDEISDNSIQETNRLQFTGGGGTMEWVVGQDGLSAISNLASSGNKIHQFSNGGGLEFEAFAVGIGFSASFDYTYTGEDSEIHTEGDEKDNETSVSFVLGDEQKWDEFVLDVFVDPKYGSFVFRTVSGISSAPHEPGTKKGEDLQIEVERPLLPALPDEPLVFYLTVSNFGENHGSNVLLEQDDTTNPKGLFFTLGGAQGGNNLEFGMLKGSTVAVLELRKGPRGYLFPPMTFVIVGPWDEQHIEEKRVEMWNYQDKEGNLWLKYEEPCPVVDWSGTLGREKKAVVDKNVKPVDLTIFNPRKADGTLKTIAEGRLEHVYALYRPQGTADWSHALLEDLSNIDFANIQNSDWEEDSYGFAAIPFDIARRLTLADDGVYEVKVESRCKELGGAPKGFNTISTDPITIVVDRVSPEQYGKSLPIRDVVIPGEEVSIAFTEPINCAVPYIFELEVRLSGLDDLFDARNLQIRCEGQTLAFQFDPSQIKYTLLMGREMAVKVNGISDLQGNEMEHPIKFEMMVADLRVDEVATSFTFTIPMETECLADDLDPVAIRDAIAKKLGMSDAGRVHVETTYCSATEKSAEARVKIGPSSGPSIPQRRLRSDQAVRASAFSEEPATAIDAYYQLMESTKEAKRARKLRSLANFTAEGLANDMPFELGHMELLPGKSDAKRYMFDTKPTKEEEMIREVANGVNPKSLRQDEHMLQLEQDQKQTNQHMDNLNNKFDHLEQERGVDQKQREVDQKQTNHHMDDIDAKLDLLLSQMAKNKEGYDYTRGPTSSTESRSEQGHGEEEYQAVVKLLQGIEIMAALLGMALFACIFVLLMCIKTHQK